MDGVLPLWKPRGYTSHDCVMKVRKIFGMKKVGHTGTLDPDAEGVLPICLGQATKIVPFLTDTTKTYIATAHLGTATETEDASGQIVETIEVTEPPSKEEIEQTLQQFTGDIIQIPPMYSAIKVNGKKLYEYARNHETVERPSRKVCIHAISLLADELEDRCDFRFKVTCSKGTYIRTLCVDIGKRLGYPAHMKDLVRVETGGFTKQDALTFDMLEQAREQGRLQETLHPIVKGVSHMRRLDVDASIAARVQYGQKLPKPDNLKGDEPFLVMQQDKLLAIYQVNPKNDTEIKPVRVFNESAGE